MKDEKYYKNKKNLALLILQGVNILGWMVVIYLILYIIIGGDFYISIKWENIK